MGVYLRYEDKWYCQGSVNGERYNLPCAGANNLKEAKAVEDGIRYQLRMKQLGLLKEPEKHYTLEFMMDMYVKTASAKNKSDREAKIYSKYIKQYFGKRRDIKDISPNNVYAFMKKLVDSGKSKATANRYMMALKRAYNIMKTNELIDYNPTDKVKKYVEDNRRYRVLSREEWDRLQKVMKPHLKEIVITALCTGFRLSNVLNLKWDCINMQLKYIEILKQDNKGKKSIKITINEVLYNLLNAHKKKSGYVFINPDTNKPYRAIKRTFNTALREAGIEDFHFHDLRRTVGTWAIHNGVDIRTVQELLGHSDISTTERYLSLNLDNMKKATDVINNLL